MAELVDMLRGGDRRSIGRVPEVVALVNQQPDLLDELLAALTENDEVVRMRAADALEKLSARQIDKLNASVALLLKLAAESEQQEVRWHLAQILPRLRLTRAELENLRRILEGYLEDDSRLVQVSAMQALVDLAGREPEQREQARRMVEEMMERGSAAVQARGRKLLQRIKR